MKQLSSRKPSKTAEKGDKSIVPQSILGCTETRQLHCRSSAWIVSYMPMLGVLLHNVETNVGNKGMRIYGKAALGALAQH